MFVKAFYKFLKANWHFTLKIDCDVCDQPMLLGAKISPITGPRCPEGSRKLRFPDYVTMAQNSEVCHPRCVFELYGEVNSVKKHNYKYMAK